MKVEKGKIISATENELLKYWLKEWSELYSFDEFLVRLKKNGVEIIDNK